MRRPMTGLASAALILIAGCRYSESAKGDGPPASYFDNAGHPDAWAGGARKITITTPKGPHQVWVKRVGSNPKLKLLLLTGGPGFSHAYLEVMDSYLPAEGVEYYHYDQLETGESDKPNDPDLWTLPRYVDEVDQVRRAIGGTRDNFCLLGHSWGGVLAIEYALAHQDQLKCLVISNMMASIPAYNAYAKNVLEPQMNQAALKEILAKLTLLLAPFAPYVTQEIWDELGNDGAVFRQPWPAFDPALAQEEEAEIPVQVNGKLRGRIRVPFGAANELIEERALQDDKVQQFVQGKQVVKIIVVAGKLVNIVIRG